MRRSGGIFDYEGRKERLTEVLRELEDPAVWSKPDRAQELGRERTKLQIGGTVVEAPRSTDDAQTAHVVDLLVAELQKQGSSSSAE